MKKTTIAGLIGLLFTTPLLAAETPINAKDVIVTASRTPQTKESVIADVTVITQEEIERAGQSSFIELLQAQPGVEISSNGGQGKLASVFLRGTNANQVVVLLDGIRISSISAGTTYFGNIPLSQIERIEILRGPASSLYGQDAIGGVIQIFSKHNDGKPHFNATVGYGTYNTRTAEAGFGGAINDFKFSLNVSSYNTDGFSALKINNDPRSDKDGYRNISLNGSASYAFSEGHELGVQLFNSNGRAKYDGWSAFSNYVDSTQTSVGIFTKNQITNIWKSTVKLSEGVDVNDDYWDIGSVTKIKSKQRQYSWQNDVALPIGTLTLLADRLEQKLISSEEYQNTARNSNGLYLGYVASIDKHSVQANLRRDDSSQYGEHITGNAGYSFQINDLWRASASYGTAFKAPTFNDVYGPIGWGANPDIKAEESKNLEAAIHFKDQNSNASAVFYKNKITNLIVSSGFPLYQMENINDAELKGLTLSGATTVNNFLLKGSLDIQSPEDANSHKLLPLRAERHGSVNLSRSIGDWRVGSELIASSERYNDATNLQKMSGYAIINLVADYKINNDWALQGRVNNLLDKDYALALSGSTPYNTPGANVFFSLRYTPSF